jgi:hypothetical protein
MMGTARLTTTTLLLVLLHAPGIPAARSNVLHMVAVRPKPERHSPALALAASPSPPRTAPLSDSLPATPSPFTPLTRATLAQDDLRTELSLAYNHPEVSTPHLDALTNKSMVFQNAYCQQPICSPSRNSFMSGLTPDHTQAWNFIQYFREARPDAVSFPEYLLRGTCCSVDVCAPVFERPVVA